MKYDYADRRVIRTRTPAALARTRPDLSVSPDRAATAAARVRPALRSAATTPKTRVDAAITITAASRYSTVRLYR